MTFGRPEKTAIVTIVSNNYIHFARTMLQSARHHHQDYAFYCVIVDSNRSYAEALDHEFEAIHLEKLNLPLGEEFLFQYNILELNTAVKPWAIEYLLIRGHKNVVYVDPDIYFYERMASIEHLLSNETDIVLTPHLLAPIADERLPRELDIRRAGAYNFGFCAVRNSANTRNFLHWWQSKLIRDCVNDADRGLFVDQSWIDLVPGLFENVGILRHKGYNVAYWNIAQRLLLKRQDDTYFVGEEPLVFFHFSGLNPTDPEAFSKHQDRFTLSTVGLAKNLVEDYVKVVIENGYNAFAKLPYGFKCFSNGEEIPEIFRKLYRASSALRERIGPHPFDDASIIREPWLDISIDGISPTNAMMALWYERRDVQFEFPLNSANSILAYYHWFTTLPTAATYYSRSVISHHIQSIEYFDKQEKKQATQTVAQMHAWRGSEKRAHSLYKHILARAPDEGGFLAYSELCKTDSGFVRAWGEIGLSAESKKKRFLWLRMLKALLFSICIEDKRGAEPIDPHASKRGELSSQSAIGIFAAEADISTLGVWVTDKVVVPINAQHGDSIKLKGFYFPESIKKQTGGSESSIRLLVGDDEIYSAHLGTHGDFTIECLFPVSHHAELTTFTIETSKFFVPQDIGLGEDDRRLAWRLKTLSVGAKNIFDCSNEKIFPEVLKSACHADVNSCNFESPQLAYSGFFQAEPDSKILGVWVSANIVVPIVPAGGERIRIQGVYFPHSIAKATGNGESLLCFIVGGRELHSATLKCDGDFSVDFTLPKMIDDSCVSLHIKCTKSFVPTNIGEGDDDRMLSWRLKRLTAGKITVFDCTCQNVATSNYRFVPRMTHNPDFSGSKVKLFAFYLPQTSDFIDDKAGRPYKSVGWAEVSNATSQYTDHHQPQLPIELGFYDYRSIGVLKRQVTLAKQYGLAGFCFHHCWPSDSHTNVQPMDVFVADTSLDIQFCVCWNIETNPLLNGAIGQYAEASSGRLICLPDSLITAFADRRYRKIDQKPVVVISNFLALPSVSRTLSLLRLHATRFGLPGLYLIAYAPRNFNDSTKHDLDFDAIVEASLQGYDDQAYDITNKIKFTNSIVGKVYDYRGLTTHCDKTRESDQKTFEVVVPAWDNSAQLPEAIISFSGATPEEYAGWLSNAVASTYTVRTEERLLFVNAWNAWSVGAHLEPDQRYGYGYLHATAAVLLNQSLDQNEHTIKAINESFIKQTDTAIIAHIFYEDLIDSIFDSYLTNAQHKCDLIVSVMQNISATSLKKIKHKFNNCYIIQTTNRGRDIRPFIIAFRKAHELGYLFGCKIHTKKSLQLDSGDAWRTGLLESLLRGANEIEKIIQRFNNEPALGLLVYEPFFFDLAEPAKRFGNIVWLDKLLSRIGENKLIGDYNFSFPGGSMFWFRINAISQLLEEDFVSVGEFELEAGQLNSTLAHAIERIVGLISTHNRFNVDTISRAFD